MQVTWHEGYQRHIYKLMVLIIIYKFVYDLEQIL